MVSLSLNLSVNSHEWCFDMSKRQAGYCDKSASGNVERWIQNCVVIDTSLEWGVFYKDTKKELTIDKVVSNEEIAADVVDKAIMRMMGNEN